MTAEIGKVAVVHNIPIHYKHLLFDAMAKRGIDFTVLFMATRSKKAVTFDPATLANGSYAYRIGFAGEYETAPAITRSTFIWKSLQNLSPATVIIGGYYAIECWVALMWAVLHRAQVVLWFESNYFDAPRHWPKETLKWIFLKGCDQAQCYGRSNADYLRRLGLGENVLLCKRAVVNADLFQTGKAARERRQSGVTRFLYVGRLAPEKNLHSLLLAFSNASVRVPDTPIRLIIAGSGPLEQELKRVSCELGIEDTVEFLGHRPQAALPAIYRSCDVFVLPSTNEPWGLVVNEAMMCRMPVIVSRQCGCAADLVTTETGWSFSPWSESELEALIVKAALCSDDQLDSMGDAAFELAIDYTPDKSADRVIRGLTRLVPA
jgi:glycosyltransferase involved in cell wall biosynthesis